MPTKRRCQTDSCVRLIVAFALRERLLAQKQVLEIPVVAALPAIVHDDKRGAGKSIATFLFNAPKSGRYELRIAYSPHETRAKKVPITIEGGAQKTTLTFDQTQPLFTGEAFRSAGVVKLTSDTKTKIIISNASTEGFVILDAIQLIEAKE